MYEHSSSISLFFLILILIFMLLPFNVIVHAGQWIYPNVRRDFYVYERFGVWIGDPYHWLENSTSEETSLFVQKQNNLTYGYIRKHPYYESIKTNFKQLYNYTAYGMPSKHGEKYYISIREPHQNQDVIHSLKSLDDPNPQIFIDPNTFSPNSTVALVFISFSPDGKWCAYGTSVGGSDWTIIKVKNVETLQDLNDKLVKIKFADIGWNKNNEGFFYAYYDKYNGTGEGTETEIPEYQKLYYHRLNTSQEKDIMIYGFPDHPKWLIGTPIISEDGQQVHLFPIQGTSNTSWLYSRFNPKFNESSDFKFEWIVETIDAEYYYIGDDERCTYIHTNYKAKTFRLVCVDLSNPSRDNWRDVIPASEYVLSNALVTNKDFLVCSYMVDVVNIIKIHNLTTGEHLFDIDTPIGTISTLGGEMGSQEFFYKFTSFLSPGIIFHYDFAMKSNKSKVYKQSTIEGLNTDDYETKQIFYTSKDGTKIPMFLVSRKNIKLNGKNPTWLNAYGGFNVNIQPEYNPIAIFFVKYLDGIFAVANIRGGGEYGDDWHHQGMLLNKQNVFDDFACAGEWLINSGFTSREYLTINGHSNGGLLVGVSSNQRPDIFGSTIAEVGYVEDADTGALDLISGNHFLYASRVMDMLKFPLFTIGYVWVDEYGDPIKNKTHFEYICRYSPLHNIREDMKQYPNMLVVTADHDDRVVPAHSYKFISELQYKLGQKIPNTPLMIRVDFNSGHGLGKPIYKWIEEYTDKICFLLNSTPYKYKPNWLQIKTLTVFIITVLQFLSCMTTKATSATNNIDRASFIVQMFSMRNQYYQKSEQTNNFIVDDNYLTNTKECAVILKRFTLKHTDQTYGLSFKAMMEALRGSSIDFHEEEAHNQICITYDDVNRAIEKAMRIRRYSKPKNIDNLEPPPEEIAETAEVIQEATRILAYRFELSYDEILNALPLIDMSRTIFWPHCPAHVKPMVCKKERFRTYTAHCNNLENPSWGAANTAFVRYLPPVYSNGVDGLRRSMVKGRKLPHPRLVTRMVHADFDRPSNDMTILVMSWGQFIDHDVALAMPPRFFIDGKETEIDCCKLLPGQSHELCMPISIPPNDPIYGPMGRKCHDFKRSIAGHRPNCALGPRVHVNILTSPIDANFIYGSTRAVAMRLRTFRGGLLKTWNIFDKERMKPLLPPEDENPDLECINRPRNLFCFLAGDVRVNEQIHLTVLHTLYVRDHNRMAIELGRINPHWDDERIYQETRHIMAATVQHIAFNEWLPIVIGDEMMNHHNLTLVSDGYWYGYDPKAHMSPSQAFTTAAFRFGHTFIQGKVLRFNKHHKMVGSHSLRNLLRRPFIVYQPGMIDELAMGLVDTPAQSYDSFITKEVSGHLFQEDDDFAGMDLPMINLLRAREQGVPGYNFYREWCGLKRAETFEDLIPMVGNRTALIYSQLYAHPDDIDLWSGGVSEFSLPNALVGPTFACIIARNFANIRKGDRFWYENPGMPSSFTPAQLKQIRKATQARIICANGDNIETIQRWPLRQAHEIFNPRVRCNEIPDLDLSYWRENPENGGFFFDYDY